jgi:ferredoxin
VSASELPQVIHVDLSRCVGHGKCYGVAPDLMAPFDDEGHAEFDAEPIDPSDLKQIARAQVAIDSCPEQALSWQDAEA